MTSESSEPAAGVRLPEHALPYGRVKWDQEVWTILMPYARQASEELGTTLEDGITAVLHLSMREVFHRLDAAEDALEEVRSAMSSLDRRSTTNRAEFALALEDWERLERDCKLIIDMARSIRSDPANVAQASVLLALKEVP